MGNLAPMDLTKIAAVADMLRGILGDDDDEAVWLDSIEGETNAFDIADMLLSRLLETDALADAVKAQEAALKARRTRLEDRGRAIRNSLGALLDAAAVRKLERPLGTVSRLAGRMSVVIEDEASIPTQLCKVVTTPDKAAIKAQLEAGEDVPGAALVRGADTVSVRV